MFTGVCVNPRFSPPLIPSIGRKSRPKGRLLCLQRSWMALVQAVQLLVVIDLLHGFLLGPGKELSSHFGELLLESGIPAFAQNEVLEGTEERYGKCRAQLRHGYKQALCKRVLRMPGQDSQENNAQSQRQRRQNPEENKPCYACPQGKSIRRRFADNGSES